MSQRRIGFTLIELLVVIAIIAILAAILFPVFAKARQKAQENTCLSNVKEIALSVLMYASDYDQYTCLMGGYGSTNPTNWPAPNWTNFTSLSSYPGPAWPQLLQPYMENTQLYMDPSQADGLVDYEFIA